MTSSNGLLWGEFTSHQWIALTRANEAGLWWSLWSAFEQTIKFTIKTLRCHPARHCNDSYNSLSHFQHQAIIWTDATILSGGPMGTYFSEIWIKTQQFLLKKLCLKMSSAKYWPPCLSLNILNSAIKLAVTNSHVPVCQSILLASMTFHWNSFCLCRRFIISITSWEHWTMSVQSTSLLNLLGDWSRQLNSFDIVYISPRHTIKADKEPLGHETIFTFVTCNA